jgi:hypothetical protein
MTSDRDTATDAIRAVEDPVILASLATTALARIGPTAGRQQLEVLTELTHTLRMLSDAAQRTAGQNDPQVGDAMWKLTGLIGTRFTAEPLPVLHGQPLPEGEDM